MSHYAVPVKPPAVPVAAATLVLLRDRSGGGFELLLVKRHTASRFAAGDHVFPGGKVDAHDAADHAAAWCAGVTAEAAAGALALDDRRFALAHWVGVIRETFEEVGILLARDAGGRQARLEPAKLAGYRAALRATDAALWDMLRAEQLTLATDALVYFAHWITPEEQPLRFNTRFFAAVTPPGQEPIADGREIVDVRWLAPREALDAAARGEISLRNATARNVELFLEAKSAADALDAVRGREIRTIRPRVIMENGVRRVLMPGDAGYW
ncbi:MAG: NUDIX hydrolase [Candidatus Rokubacteria bacterium]|nr:NUDIX hydrolase [Candidatus Rokubacteria bacterium]